MSKIENDKYYTPTPIVQFCCRRIQDFAEEFGIQFSEVIEPSAGNGAFLNQQLVSIDKAYDIEPEDDRIIAADFLTLTIPHLKGRLVLGNPPFGRSMQLARQFYAKACEIGDYVGFILPISQLKNTHSLKLLPLVYSADLGMQTYSGIKLHCCFNIYAKVDQEKLIKLAGKGIGYCDPRQVKREKLKDIKIYREDKKDYDKMPYDLRITYWGFHAGRILNEDEHYAAEYKIQIINPKMVEPVKEVLENFDWPSYLKCIAARKIQQFHIYDVLRENIPEIR